MYIVLELHFVARYKFISNANAVEVEQDAEKHLYASNNQQILAYQVTSDA